MSTTSRFIMERYAALLPVTADTPLVTLGEGGTPLVRSRIIGPALGLDALYFKLEYENPTGSFKDRGMVLAVAKAVEEGATALLCASTGNTSASAAAYAARHGLRAYVVVPSGRIAAREAGAGDRARRRDRGHRWLVRRRAAHRAGARAAPGRRARELRQPVPHRGPEDRRLRDRRRPRRRARPAVHPGRQRWEHHRLLARLYRVLPARARLEAAEGVGLSGRRRRAARPRPPGREARDDRDRHPHRQPRVVAGGGRARATSPRAPSRR